MTDLEKVRQDGYAISYIENPSMEVQLAAVRQNGYAIMYIKKPSIEVQVQLEAVLENGGHFHPGMPVLRK